MGKHALLSASSSKRWLSCTPSARLEEQFQEESGGSVYNAGRFAVFSGNRYLIIRTKFEKFVEECSAI